MSHSFCVSAILPKEWEADLDKLCKKQERSRSYFLRKGLQDILFGAKNEDEKNTIAMQRLSQESFQEWNSKEDDEQFAYLETLITK
jgi:hypothetical protein